MSLQQAIDLAQKQCSNPDCKQWYPATPEFFHRDKRCPSGLARYCKICKNKERNAYYHAHHEHEIAKQRAYYQANKEQVAEHGKHYRKANKDHIKAYRQAYSAANKERIAGNSKRHYEANKSSIRARIRANRHKQYGMTKEEWLALYEQQSGLCPVCLNPLPVDLAIDHCHKTGLVRGLLCRRCNVGLGQFEDDPAMFIRGYLYVIRKEQENGLADSD